METVTVACKLPSGFNPEFENKQIFNGTNTPGARVVAGYGITENVPKADYERWAKKATQGQFPPLLNGLIFAEPTTERAVDMARELSGEFKSGFEPLNPDEPGSGVQTDVATMQTGDEAQKALAAEAKAKGAPAA